MKHIVITSTLFILLISKGFPQANVFTIIDIATIKENYKIVSCRDDSAKTIQFQVDRNSGKNIAGPGKPNVDPFKLGSKVKADFSSASVSTLNNPANKYKIVKPFNLKQFCVFKSLYYFMSGGAGSLHLVYFVIGETETKERVSFQILTPQGPSLLPGQPIFEKLYNNIRYAVLLPSYPEEQINNIYYSYSLEAPDTQTNNSGNSSSTGNTTSSPYWEMCCYSAAGAFFPWGTLYIKSDEDAELLSIKIFFPGDPTKVLPVQLPNVPSGTWDVQLSEKMVSSVPFNNGKTTRIKAGALKISSNSPWALYDSNMTKIYSASYRKKVEFPVGIYQLEINGSMHQIQIKDTLTTDYIDSSAQAQTQQYNMGTHAIWEMQIDPTLKGLTGEVTMQIPKEVQFNTHMEFYETGDTKKPVASWFGNNKAKLLPGLYDILIDKKYIIKNVPVEQGKQTRLKMGVLQWSGYGSIVLEDANHQKFSYGAPFKKVLPIGTYTIVGRKQKPNTFEISDGKLTEF